MQDQRTFSHLEERCLSGEAAALRAFFYREADGMYAAALAVCGTSEQALDLCHKLAQELAGDLGRWRPPRPLGTRLRWRFRRAAARAGAGPAAESAMLLWGASEEQSLLPAPPQLLAYLEEMAAAGAAGARARRRRWKWAQRAAGVLAGLVLVVGIGAALQWGRGRAEGQTRQMVLASLQERVQEGHLPWSLRDQWLDLTGAEGGVAAEDETLAQASLLLEEIGSLAPEELGQNLPQMQQRLEEGDLLVKLRSLAQETGEERHGTMMQTVLVLEEVEAL